MHFKSITALGGCSFPGGFCVSWSKLGRLSGGACQCQPAKHLDLIYKTVCKGLKIIHCLPFIPSPSLPFPHSIQQFVLGKLFTKRMPPSKKNAAAAAPFQKHLYHSQCNKINNNKKSRMLLAFDCCAIYLPFGCHSRELHAQKKGYLKLPAKNSPTN